MHSPQDGLLSFFCSDHRHADELWAAFEAACDGEPALAAEAFARFASVTRTHLAMEEEVIFPEFESKTGSRGGPTLVMKGEHTRMRALLDEMQESVNAGEFETALDQGDTLLLLTGQHNQKEEGILYPMAQKLLESDWSRIAIRLEEWRGVTL